MASVRGATQLIGFEEGMPWLPSHVLDEPCNSNSKIHMRSHHQKQQQQSYHRYPRETQSQCSKYCTRSSSYQKPKHATGGPGMQAVFLVSGQGSCGTGVFLPQKAGTKSLRKPACAPVLLPARVVQALNLKVHQLGLQISPSQGPKYSPRSGEVSSSESTKRKSDEKDGLKQCCVISESQSSSPEIFLPKEWTY